MAPRLIASARGTARLDARADGPAAQPALRARLRPGEIAVTLRALPILPIKISGGEIDADDHARQISDLHVSVGAAKRRRRTPPSARPATAPATLELRFAAGSAARARRRAGARARDRDAGRAGGDRRRDASRYAPTAISRSARASAARSRSRRRTCRARRAARRRRRRRRHRAVVAARAGAHRPGRDRAVARRRGHRRDPGTERSCRRRLSRDRDSGEAEGRGEVRGGGSLQFVLAATEATLLVAAPRHPRAGSERRGNDRNERAVRFSTHWRSLRTSSTFIVRSLRCRSREAMFRIVIPERNAPDACS